MRRPTAYFEITDSVVVAVVIVSPAGFVSVVKLFLILPLLLLSFLVSFSFSYHKRKGSIKHGSIKIAADFFLLSFIMRYKS
jgi:hypothetical protein